MAEPSTSERRRLLRGWPGRLLAAAALIAVIAVVLVVVLNSNSSPSASGSTNASATGAASVQRRNLVETDTEAGTLSYSGSQTVYDRLSGTITWLPNVGQVIKPGQALFDVNEQPVLLMDGSTPAYRDLSPDDTDGADITELNRNLVRLGFNADAIDVDDVWQPATTYGVELLQEALGEDPTGTITLGQVVFLPGDQLISTVDGTVGSTGSGGGTPTLAPVSAPRPDFVSLEKPASSSACHGSSGSSNGSGSTGGSTSTTSTTSTTATSTTSTTTSATTTPSGSAKCPTTAGHHAPSTSAQTLAALQALLKAESAQLKAEEQQLRAEKGSGTQNNGKGSGSGSGKSNGGNSSKNSGSGSSGSGSSNNGSGSGDNSGTAVLQTTSTHLVVTVDLSASSQSEAVVGERVTVEMPAGNTVNGRITAVSPVAQSSSDSGSGSGSGGNGSGNGNGNGNGSGSTSTIPVTVTLSGRHTGAGLDQAAVSVNFAQARANNVLSVPVTALLATSGGNYAVQEADAPHQLLPVTTGLFAAGYVQISGSGIYQGLQVTDSQG